MTLALIEIDLKRIRALAAKADAKLLLYLVEMALVEVRKAALIETALVEVRKLEEEVRR